MTEKKAGRELDALVAERVMGFDLRRARSGNPPGWYTHPDRYTRKDPPVPHYSTSIASAWEVVERTVERTGLDFDCGYGESLVGGYFGWYAYFGDPSETGSGLCETAALAICLAALKAVDPEAA